MNRQQRQAHRIVWFEIPSTDFDRAVRFYETLSGLPMRRETIAGNQMAVFDYDGSGISGCVIHGPQYQPANGGVCIYLNADRDGLDATLARAESAGGKMLTPPVTLPGEMGRFAHIRDSEGNLLGLHEAGA